MKNPLTKVRLYWLSRAERRLADAEYWLRMWGHRPDIRPSRRAAAENEVEKARIAVERLGAGAASGGEE
jgi:hypothetical protein